MQYLIVSRGKWTEIFEGRGRGGFGHIYELLLRFWWYNAMQNDSKPKQGLNHECNTNERVAKKKELINVRLKTLHISGPFLTK